MKAIPMNTPENEHLGEFAAFLDSGVDALAAYVYHKYGEELLREMLKPVVDWDSAYPGPKETLEEAAAELEHRGLDKPAAVLYELAELAPSGVDLVPDYMVNAGPRFVEGWRETWRQQRLIRLGLWGQELRRTIARNTRQSKDKPREILISQNKPSPTS
jgi:hypothetical protein